MTQLVFIDNGRVVTDTLIISEMFGKTHDNVMRDTRNQIEKIKEAGESEFSLLNFEESTYTSDRGRNYPKIDMTEEGFVLVAMSYVTAEAMKMKVKFIQEFKRMREQISKMPVLTERQAMIQSLKLAVELAEEVDQIKETTEAHGTKLMEIEQKVEKQITLNSGEQRRLQKAIAQKVYSVEPDEDFRSELFRQLYKEVKDRWQVPSYKDILRQDLQSVLRYVEAWVPIRQAG